jgi:hypothetical protein
LKSFSASGEILPEYIGLAADGFQIQAQVILCTICSSKYALKENSKEEICNLVKNQLIQHDTRCPWLGHPYSKLTAITVQKRSKDDDVIDRTKNALQMIQSLNEAMKAIYQDSSKRRRL